MDVRITRGAMRVGYEGQKKRDAKEVTIVVGERKLKLPACDAFRLADMLRTVEQVINGRMGFDNVSF